MYISHIIDNYVQKNSSICGGKLIILLNAVCHISPKIALSSLKNTDRFLLPNKLINSEKTHSIRNSEWLPLQSYSPQTTSLPSNVVSFRVCVL